MTKKDFNLNEYAGDVVTEFMEHRGRGGNVATIDGQAMEDLCEFVHTNMPSEHFNYELANKIPANGFTVPAYEDKKGNKVEDEKLNATLQVDFDTDDVARLCWWYGKKGGGDWGNGQLKMVKGVRFGHRPRLIYDLNLRFDDKKIMRHMIATFIVWVSPIRKLDICLSDRVVFGSQYDEGDLFEYLDFVDVREVQNEFLDEFEDVLIEYPEDIKDVGMFSSTEGYELIKSKLRAEEKKRNQRFIVNQPHSYFKVAGGQLASLVKELAK